MNSSEQRDLVEATQRQIASLLAALEKQTGWYVDSIGIETIEVTNLNSTTQDFVRRVDVEMCQPLGSRWQT